MGWASGSRLMTNLIESVKNSVDDFDSRVELYLQMIKNFEDADCDTLDECLGEDEAFDEAWKRAFPEPVYVLR